MRILDDQARELDAEVDIEDRPYGVDLILHSRSGNKSAGVRRNPDYFPALEAILLRLAAVDAVLNSVVVDSTVARRLLQVQDRVVPAGYPIRLSAHPDLLSLRRQLTAGQRTIARRGTAQGAGGNNHKKIRLAVDLRSTSVDSRALTTHLRVSGPSLAGQGSTYRRAKANPTVSPSELFTFDPASRERALAAHAAVQNGFADHLNALGLTPLSPTLEQPDFDLAWIAGGVFHVVEVKSLSGMNPTQQMRLGLGQVLQYRETLRKAHGKVAAVLAVEAAPAAEWLDVCRAVDVRLAWPPQYA